MYMSFKKACIKAVEEHKVTGQANVIPPNVILLQKVILY